MSFHPLFACRALVAGAMLAWSFAWSAEPLMLDEAQRIAVSRSQQVAANEAAAVGARRIAQAAGQLPDPVLKAGIDNLPLNGPDRFSLTRDFMTMRRIGVMQELPDGGKRRLRTLRAVQDALRLQAERDLLVVNARRETALAWLDRRYALAQRELLLLQADEARLQADAAEASYRGARGSQADVFAARTAVSLIEDKLNQTDTQARNAALMLARWVGADAQRLPSGTVPWQTTELDKGFTIEHLEDHPTLAVAAAQVQSAQLDVALAQAGKRPDWTVEATYSQRGPAYSNMLSVGISVPLQLDRANRQDQEVGARLAELDAVLARYEDLLRSEEADVSVMLNDWRNGKSRVDRFSASLLPLAQQRTFAALAAYRGGKGELSAVLAARREELELRLQASSVELETARAWAKLNFLTAGHAMATGNRSQP